MRLRHHDPDRPGRSATSSTTPIHPMRRRPLGRPAILLLVAGILVLSGCAGDSDDFVAGAGDLGHIHDLALDEDGTLLVASHSGLYRIEDETRAVLIGVQHDLMSMTRLPDGDLLASGHPNLLLEEFRVEDRPPFFGLARSTDGGRNWDQLDLLGEADFHALAPVDEGLYAAEATGAVWFRGPDGGWTVMGDVAARDLAVDPANPQRQLAPDDDTVLWVSQDGAATWERAGDAPAFIEVEWVRSDEILGITEAGSIWSASTSSGPWAEIANGPADVETFYVDPTGAWWVTLHGGKISRTDDQGRTWQVEYTPPERG